MAEEPDNTISGHAALSICESLLLALRDLKIMTPKDARDILTDAATAHREESLTSKNADLHTKVAALIERISAAGNSLPRV